MVAAFDIEDYSYELPEERIAKYPLENRDDSKLLIYESGKTKTGLFKNILNHLPSNSYLLFNDTKVISARIIFYKESGARIELFLIEPLEPSQEMSIALETTGSCAWECTIGNRKRWKNGQSLVLEYQINGHVFRLTANYYDFERNIIMFTWNDVHSFAEVIESVGHTPIPPYLNRDDELVDKDRYQTVYSLHQGAVAAPTAGLHFTDPIIKSLNSKNIHHGFVTLHVSAGTFKPIQETDYREHKMHSEHVMVPKKTLESIVQSDQVYCVGTTSLRTLESIYWLGVKKLLINKNSDFVDQYIYNQFPVEDLPDQKEALKFLIEEMDQKSEENLKAITEIFIYPGYNFKMCRGLITNFHLPKSTLLLLVAAFIGEDWKKIYQQAKNENFRFLSYGDASLLKLS